MSSAEQALEQERIARKRLEAEIALERAESGSLSSAPSAAPTDTESDADGDPLRGSRRQSRFKRGQRPDGALRSSPLADYVMQGFSQVACCNPQHLCLIHPNGHCICQSQHLELD